MPAEDAHRVVCHLDELLERAGMTLTDLAREVGVTVVNLSVLKNDRARAVRFSTLTAICDVLGCQPGDVFRGQRHPDILVVGTRRGSRPERDWKALPGRATLSGWSPRCGSMSVR